ncbi:MAG TPA: amidase family protein, partial [Steroidobacteraceae bacterium]|nr:amidase family protein [Steroidobacteraceae bacterium]
MARIERRKTQAQARGAGSASATLSRRSLLQASALAGSGALLGTWSTSEAQNDASTQHHGDRGRDRDIAFATIAEQQALMSAGRISSRELVEIYLRRIHVIDKQVGLNSVLQVNPDAFRIAAALDRERRQQGARGPLHGIPILLKDNIDTGDRMQTTAGSLALAGAPALQDSTMAARLRTAGAV